MPRNVLRFTIVVLILSAQWQSTPTGICSAEQDLSPWVWPFTHEQKRAIVETHNMLRREVIPEASNMRKMVWDDDLAQLAQDWSEECIFAHTPDKEYEATIPACDLIKVVTIVRNAVIQVGAKTNCVVSIMSYISNVDCMLTMYAEECLLLCLNCATKVTTDDCKCSCNTGWMGLDCTDECADSHYYCWDGWYPMLCGEPEWDFVAKYCPLMCGVCVDEAYIPEEHCCDGKQCSQGVIDGATCDCSCYEGYGADYECVESVSGSKTLNLNVIPIVMTSLLLILVC
uniref:Uncharacterized protein LOC102806400 n=1 Tax=Saccoglossus kowalevskii TaxID=10224 RepID=A0ABM0N1D0_SACKO|nr:PREDICTED: uncharacterized protein LOC102806400 [Saccoglossus kowalevskii]